MNPAHLIPLIDNTYQQALSTWPSWRLNLNRTPRVLGEIPGGKTNRSFLLQTNAGQALVLRLFSPQSRALGICRQREYNIHLAVADIGLAPDIIYWNQNIGFSVVHAVPGTTWQTSDFNNDRQKERLKQAIEEYQTLTVPGLIKFDYPSHLDAYAETTCAALNREEQQQWQDFRQRLELWQAGNWHACVTHHDLIASNIIDGDNKLTIIDWEYAGLGHPFFDTLDVCNNFATNCDELLLRELRGWLNRLWQLRLSN